MFVEATLLPYVEAHVNRIPITWDKIFLQRVCELDSTTVDSFGFIVSPKMGIAIAGIHDDDPSQMAITVFSESYLASWLEDAAPFRL